MKLNYFGKIVDGLWRKDQHSVDVEHITQKPIFPRNPDGSKKIKKRSGKAFAIDHDSPESSFTTDTQADFIFNSAKGRTIRVERPFLAIREDAPISIRGLCKHNTAPLVDPAGLCVAVYGDGTIETVYVKESRTLKEKLSPMESKFNEFKTQGQSDSLAWKSVARIIVLGVKASPTHTSDYLNKDDADKLFKKINSTKGTLDQVIETEAARLRKKKQRDAN